MLWHLVWESHLSYSEFIQTVRFGDGLGEALKVSNSIELETAEYQCLVSPSAQDTSRLKPESTTVRAAFGAVSHAGKVRPKNEDHFLVFRLGRNQEALLTNIPADQLPEHTGEAGYSMIVADGMGGMAAGEVASRLAITTALKLVHKSPKWGFKINQKEARELFERINCYIREIDKTLTERADADPRLFGMGTTLTAAFSMGVDLFIIHLGDSRAYLYRNGELQRLTKDHTMAQAMADAGYIAPEDVRRHARRNTLTNYLGGRHGKVKADLRWLRLRDGDRLLLCTDGLTEMVDDRSIERILHERDEPRDAAQALLDEALEQGGKDNVTVIVARYEIPKPAISSTQDTDEYGPREKGLEMT
jgi:protein phosphatase